MQITSTTSASGTQPSGGLFGQQGLAGAGLFGLLMALFGQGNAATGSQPAAGQNLPGLPATAHGTPGLLDPSSLLTANSTADGTTEGGTLDANSLLALLQQLNGGQPVSTTLQTLLGGDHLDAATLNARLDALPDDQYQAVMAELAGLLQPLVAPLPAPAALAASVQTETDIAAVPSAPAAPVIPDTPVSAADPDPAPAASPAPVAADDTPADTSPDTSQQALTTLTEVLQKQQDRAQTRPHGPAHETGLANALARLSENGSETAAVQRPDSSGLPTLAAIKPADSSGTTPPAPAGTNTTAEAGASAVTAPAQPQAADAPQRPAPAAHSQTQTAQGLHATATTDDGSQQTATSKDSLPSPTLPQPAAAGHADTSFSSHLDQIRLNRTGAHMPVTDQVAVHLTRAVQNGHDRMTIRLHPAELGRIEVRLDMSADGLVKASFHVDQPATLDLLQRDAKGLERALGDAGLKTDGSSLNFNLRGDGNMQRQTGSDTQGQQNQTGSDTPAFSADGSEPERAPAGIIETAWYVGPDRVDVRI